MLKSRLNKRLLLKSFNETKSALKNDFILAINEVVLAQNERLVNHSVIDITKEEVGTEI